MKQRKNQNKERIQISSETDTSSVNPQYAFDFTKSNTNKS